MASGEGGGTDGDDTVPPPQARVVVALRWLMLVGLGALVVAGVSRFTSTRERQAAAALATAGGAATIHACPMHPAVTGPADSACPICGMRLIATSRGHAADGARAAPAPEPEPPASITIDAPATITAPERSLVQVTGRLSGWIEKLDVTETGRHVERGQILAQIYSPELIRAQKTLLNTRRWESNGQPNLSPSHDGEATGEMFAEARFRIEAFGLDSRDIDTILSKGLQRTVPVRAPQAGVVIRKDAVAGGYVQPGAPLFTIADLSTVSVVGDVLEADVGRVHVGQAARVLVRALPDETFTGQVSFMAPVLDSAGGSVQVRVDLPNPGLRLRPGSTATLRLALPARRALAAP
ncbi:MAG: rane fusion protein copper/silver efflux system [Myxococcales bacterium]|jgi:Cu(I)/Ag(I) efflux system membrane fusion protein|nr:rane fusion protein copper/silver efflux system [Myxococcales bacterium]